ncbi:MAG: hypothetical protein IJX14_04040 [Clostridia bacterium]|nr:hypothetical protein [Clostridia bacterium]
MMYYTPPNPNHALIPHPRKHPVLQALRSTGIVLLSILLVFALTFTVCIAAVRTQVTPEYVYAYADGLEYIDFPLPLNGSFVSVSELIQYSFGQVGFPLTAQDVEVLFDQFSIPAILAGFARDVTAWLLYNEAKPVLAAEEIAAVAISGMSPSILNILDVLGDPVEILGNMLVTPLSALDTEGLYDAMEPVRFLLSADVLAVSVSVCLMLAVLLFCLCRVSAGRSALPWGLSLVGCGILLTVIGAAAPASVRLLTVVYAAYLDSFLMPVLQSVRHGALVCILAGIVLVMLWLLRFLILRNRAVTGDVSDGGKSADKTEDFTQNGTNVPDSETDA